MEPQLVDIYVVPGQVTYEYRDYAFLGPESRLAAEAAVCAEEQDRFWQFHDTVFANQGQENTGNITEPRLRQMAEAIGLDLAGYDACMASDRPEQHVAADRAEAQDQGVRSTPSVFVNGQMIEWDGWDGLRQAIDAALADRGA